MSGKQGRFKAESPSRQAATSSRLDLNSAQKNVNENAHASGRFAPTESIAMSRGGFLSSVLSGVPLTSKVVAGYCCSADVLLAGLSGILQACVTVTDQVVGRTGSVKAG